MSDFALPFPQHASASSPLPAALLWHASGTGPDHFDLLLAERVPTNDADRVCATWRTSVDPGLLAPGESMSVEPIAAHRAAYLTLATAVNLDRGRGRVTPVRHGTWSLTKTDAGPPALHIEWTDGTRVVLHATEPNRWMRMES